MIRFGIGWISTPIILAALVAAWQAYTGAGAISPFILPPPLAVLHALGTLLGNPDVYGDIGVTLVEAVGGFAIASLLGVALGALLGKVAWLEQALQPILVGIQVTPKVVLVPLFILWFGFGTGSKIAIAAMLAFLPILGNTLLGVKSVAPGHRDVMRSLRAGRWARFVLLELPSALPNVLAGMEVGIILAMIGAIVGEFLAGNDGLGHLAVAYLNAFKVDLLFADIVVLACVGACLYLAVAALRRWLTGWHASGQAGAI